MMPVAEMIESLYSQGVIEQDLGEFGSARTHFEKFLQHWGAADTHLPQAPSGTSPKWYKPQAPSPKPQVVQAR